jgi:hypothetical protein
MVFEKKKEKFIIGEIMFNSIRKLFFISVVICLGLFNLGCPLTPISQDSSNPNSQGSIIELREAEHKAAQHPEKKYYANVQPDGLQVSFHTAQGHFGSYTFPHKAFTQGEPSFLSCPGSPDLLPMRVALVRGASNDLNVYHDYRIEWLDNSPATSGGARIVRSY